jgi:hypothetical protein
MHDESQQALAEFKSDLIRARTDKSRKRGREAGA